MLLEKWCLWICSRKGCHKHSNCKKAQILQSTMKYNKMRFACATLDFDTSRILVRSPGRGSQTSEEKAPTIRGSCPRRVDRIVLQLLWKLHTGLTCCHGKALLILKLRSITGPPLQELKAAMKIHSLLSPRALKPLSRSPICKAQRGISWPNRNGVCTIPTQTPPKG